MWRLDEVFLDRRSSMYLWRAVMTKAILDALVQSKRDKPPSV
jgi:transposase-like protein